MTDIFLGTAVMFAILYFVLCVYISAVSRYFIDDGSHRLNAVQFPASIRFPMDLFRVDISGARTVFVVAVWGCRITLIGLVTSGLLVLVLGFM